MTLYFAFPDWISTEIIPGLPFRWYGMMYLVAFAVTYLLFMYQVKRRKLDVDPDTVLNMFFWIIIGLLIGARIFATLLFDESGRYWARPWLIFWPFDENMNFVGLQGNELLRWPGRCGDCGAHLRAVEKDRHFGLG